jgi:hypothetical protein
MAAFNPLDQFYTAAHEVECCLSNWKDMVQVSAGGIVIEPSAGAGAFSNKIEKCIAYDLEPKAAGIIEQDFLKLDFSQFEKREIHFIGNPPFGRNSKLVFKFIKQIVSYKYTASFSLIMPVSHKGNFYKNKINSIFTSFMNTTSMTL